MNNINPIVSKIRIYPIKSLGHIELDTVRIGRHSLKGDRSFAMVDLNGQFMNGKRNSDVNLLGTNYDIENNSVTFLDKKSGSEHTFELRAHNIELEKFISDFFGSRLKFMSNDQGEFMDIPLESSVTIVSESSLTYLKEHMESERLEGLRQRFRSNLEIGHVPAFWEETLFQERGIGIRFKIGDDVEMIGVSPRARCNVPPQNPENGEMDYHFVKNMLTARNELLSEHSYLANYGRTSYFLTLNTFIPKSEYGKILNINDKISIIGSEGLTLKSVYE